MWVVVAIITDLHVNLRTTSAGDAEKKDTLRRFVEPHNQQIITQLEPPMNIGPTIDRIEEGRIASPYTGAQATLKQL